MMCLIAPLTPESWISVLTLYGPMALFVFMVFVLLTKATSITNLTREQKKVQLVALSGVWLSIFVLAIVISVVYWRVNFPAEFVIKGVVRNMRDPATLSTAQEMFLRRYYKGGLDFDYQWRIISAQRFTDPLEVQLQKTPTDRRVLKYQIPIRDDFYNGLVEITYNRATDKMTLSHGGRTEEIVPSIDELAEFPRPLQDKPLHWLSTVYAQSNRIPPEELIQALDSNDPIIREHARRDLISLGTAALPQIERVLGGDNIPGRILLGVLVALDHMDSSARAALSQAARCEIKSLTSSPDPIVRAEATRLMKTGGLDSSSCPGSRTADRVSGVPGKLTMKGWRPVALAFDSASGLFALDRQGGVNRIITDPNGPHLVPLFRIPPSYSPIDIAAAARSVFVAARGAAGAIVFQRSVDRNAEAKPVVIMGSTFHGIATDGKTLFATVSGTTRGIAYWDLFQYKRQVWDLSPLTSPGPLAFDATVRRLLTVDGAFGRLYSVSIQDGKRTRISDYAGDPTALACSTDYVITASNHDIAFLSLRDGSRRPAPAAIRALNLKGISALAVDGSQHLWIADYDGVRGPIELQ